MSVKDRDNLGLKLAISPELLARLRASQETRQPQPSASALKGEEQATTEWTYLKKDGIAQKLPQKEIVEEKIWIDSAAEAEEAHGNGSEAKQLETVQDSWENIDENFDLKLPIPPVETSRDQQLDEDVDSIPIAPELASSFVGEAPPAPVSPRPPLPDPVLLVNLTSICGFRVSEADSGEIVKHLNEQLHEKFIQRSEELFEIGACRHSTSDECVAIQKRLQLLGDTVAIVPYPELVEGRLTAELWEEICRPSRFQAVETVLQYARVCGRDLVWKHAIREELERVAEIESKAQEERDDQSMAKSLAAWREQRRNKLRWLVSVRPMFASRVEQEEQRAHAAGEGLVGIDGVARPINVVTKAAIQEFEKKLEQIDELIAELELAEVEDGYGPLSSGEEEDPQVEIDALLGMQDNNNHHMSGDEPDLEVVDEDSSASSGAYKESEDTSSQIVSNTNVREADVVGEGGPERQIERRRRRKKKKKGKPKDHSGSDTKESHDITSVSAHDVLKSDKEARDRERRRKRVDDTSVPLSQEDFTLIDSVAAMILGRMPRDPAISELGHTEFLSTSHQHIREVWLEEFGRLPTG